jgi:hypothetical protein
MQELVHEQFDAVEWKKPFAANDTKFGGGAVQINKKLRVRDKELLEFFRKLPERAGV